MTLTPDQLAQQCADTMWQTDHCSQAMGMMITDVGAGWATLTMVVRQDMLNGQQICHGGVIFTLADSAFAFACNAYNQFTVAQHCNISFLKPVKYNDQLTASATERSREGRSGIYDVVVTQSDGTVVAEFRGFSRAVRGHIVHDDDTNASASVCVEQEHSA